MAIYESEHTKFMREWMENHPEEREEQRKGRALWWDKPQSPSEASSLLGAHLPAKALENQR